jgi:Fic family protein
MRDSRAHVEAPGGRPQGRLIAVVRHRVGEPEMCCVAAAAAEDGSAAGICTASCGGTERAAWTTSSRGAEATHQPARPADVEPCMGALELFLHAPEPGVPELVRAALVHVQFETIHPFLDGDGRVGRLLIPVMLAHAGVLAQPLLHLSLFFREHQDEYYRLLGQVRIDGDWEAWVDFFLEGVEETASGALTTANRLLELMRSDRVRVSGLQRSAGAASRVFSVFCERPVASVGDAAARLGVSLPTATRGIEALAGLGIVSEITGRQRNRLYAYDEYLSILTREPAA